MSNLDPRSKTRSKTHWQRGKEKKDKQQITTTRMRMKVVNIETPRYKGKMKKKKRVKKIEKRKKKKTQGKKKRKRGHKGGKSRFVPMCNAVKPGCLWSRGTISSCAYSVLRILVPKAPC